MLIAGLASDRRMWDGFELRLAVDARVVTFDHRGMGGTPAQRGPYTIATLASDVLRLMDALGLDRADLMGVSMGGMVALELASTHADRVRTLVLGCTHPGGKLQILPEPGVLDRLPGLGKTMAEMVADFLAVTHSSRFLAAHPTRFQELLDHRSRTGFSRRTYVLQLGAILTHDVCSRLDQVRVPTLVMTGDDDQLVPLANAVLLAERLPSARLVVLHDVGHAFWIEAPGRAAQEVLAFLGKSRTMAL